MKQFRFICQGQMPKLDHILAVTRNGEFTLFVGKIGTRNIAGIHCPKHAFDLDSRNTYRSSIKHGFKKLLGDDWHGFGGAASVTIGWSDHPSLVIQENIRAQLCTFSRGMCEFAALSMWIRKVLSWPIRVQKIGVKSEFIKIWFSKQLAIKRRVKSVT